MNSWFSACSSHVEEGITTFHRGYEPDGRWILLDFPVMAFGEKDRFDQRSLPGAEAGRKGKNSCSGTSDGLALKRRDEQFSIVEAGFAEDGGDVLFHCPGADSEKARYFLVGSSGDDEWKDLLFATRERALD